MNTTANFSEYKKKFCESIVYVGDTVEWQDYDGTQVFSKVLRIEYAGIGETTFAGSVEALPLWEKSEYVLHLESGLTVAGCALVRKVIRKLANKNKPITPYSRKAQ